MSLLVITIITFQLFLYWAQWNYNTIPPNNQYYTWSVHGQAINDVCVIVDVVRGIVDLCTCVSDVMSLCAACLQISCCRSWHMTHQVKDQTLSLQSSACALLMTSRASPSKCPSIFSSIDFCCVIFLIFYAANLTKLSWSWQGLIHWGWWRKLLEVSDWLFINNNCLHLYK